MTRRLGAESGSRDGDDLAALAMSRTPAAEADGLAAPRRHWSVLTIWLAISMSVLDSSIANVALPTIARDLDASPSAAIWVVSSYQVAITMALLPIAALGDIAGYRRIYLLGLSLFVAASLGCALATSLTWLSVARFLQGIGAAGVMGIHGAMVRFTYPARLLGRGIGWNATMIAIWFAAGPGIAAAILSVGDWRWLFAVNLPIGVLAIVIGWRALPDIPRGLHRFDIASAALCAATFGPFFLGASTMANGELSGSAFALVGLGVAAGLLLIRRARAQAHPLLPLDLLRMPMLRLSYATSTFGFASQTAMLIALPFYFEQRFGFDLVTIGLLIIPMPATLAIAAPLAGHFVDRVSAGVMCAVGLALLAAGQIWLVVMQPGTRPALIGGAMVLCGAGFGMFQTPNNRTIVMLTPRARMGSGGGMTATARMIGQTSAAVMVALLFHLAGGGTPAPLIAAAGLGLLAALMSLSRIATDNSRRT